MNETRDAFLLFDDRGDDRVSRNHLGEIVRALGLNPSEADVKRCSKDLENTDRITFEEFLPIFESLTKRKSELNLNEGDFIEGLRVFDKDSSGMIHSAEFRHLLTAFGERFTDEEAELVLNGLEDHHGNINYEEFVRMLLKN